MKELVSICRALERLGDEPTALATVVQVQGSAYRAPGARMLITRDGRTWGMVSGGCLEHDVLDHARRAMQSGVPRTARYDSTTEEDIVFGTGLGCNGVVDVFIQPVHSAFRQDLMEAVARCNRTRLPGGLATTLCLAPNENPIPIVHAFVASDGLWAGSDVLAPALNRRPATTDAAQLVSIECGVGEVQVFIQPLVPPLHLVVFGGWLDVIPLVLLAKELGWKVTVVDSRQRLSSREFFQKADEVLLCSAEAAVSRIALDQRTVAVLMNHNFESDQEALGALRESALPYVGMLGPKRRQERLLSGLSEAGTLIPERMIASLHGPVGLDIGAQTPEEIALAITAEILTVLRHRDAAPSRLRASPLHTPVEKPTAIGADAVLTHG